MVKLIDWFRHQYWKWLIDRVIGHVYGEYLAHRVQPDTHNASRVLNEKMVEVRSAIFRSDVTGKQKLDKHLRDTYQSSLRFIERIANGEITYH